MTRLAFLLALLIAGQARADGDTLSFRLHGIDTPEQRQVCKDGWPAGRIATDALAAMVKGRTIACEPRGHDRWGRIIAICRADGYDLGRILVRSGLAWNYDRFSDEYEQDEALARSEGLGVHAHGCIEPWLWRAEQRAKH